MKSARKRKPRQRERTGRPAKKPTGHIRLLFVSRDNGKTYHLYTQHHDLDKLIAYSRYLNYWIIK